MVGIIAVNIVKSVVKKMHPELLKLQVDVGYVYFSKCRLPASMSSVDSINAESHDTSSDFWVLSIDLFVLSLYVVLVFWVFDAADDDDGIIIVRPPLANDFSKLINCEHVDESKPDVGSSKNITGGLLTNSNATDRRFLCPPDKFIVFVLAASFSPNVSIISSITIFFISGIHLNSYNEIIGGTTALEPILMLLLLLTICELQFIVRGQVSRFLPLIILQFFVVFVVDGAGGGRYGGNNLIPLECEL
uniref:CSON002676 protein n=1 Tax=Culicoides sonorensis TaxID=179676 RepID=A0A336K7L2_CULSO